MEKWKTKAIELVSGLLLTGKQNPAVIPYVPSKTVLPPPAKHDLPAARPEKHGVAPDVLIRLVRELEAEPRANLHSILILRGGEVIFGAAHPGYDPYLPHLSYSMSKTVTGMAIGLLVDEGKLSLEETVGDLFPECTPKDARTSLITVHDLLRMSSGIRFNEAGSVTETEWTAAALGSDLAFAPGTAFSYNSMNSYLLARIAERKAGLPLEEYLTPRLFSPLGITDAFWEKSPEGTAKGGWGLYLSAASWAKLGLLFLSDGVWKGKRIFSSAWVRLATGMQNPVSPEKGNYDYGYQLWVGRDTGEILYNGMLGQNVWIHKPTGTVVSLNSGNNEIFQDSPALALISRALMPLPDVRLPGDRAGYRELQNEEKHFFEDRHWIAPSPLRHGILHRLGLWSPLPDRKWRRVAFTYAFAPSTANILPLFVRVMQNHYPGALSTMTIAEERECIRLTFRIGEETVGLPAGLYDFAESELSLQGEHYRVRAMAQATEDENRNPVYKIELLYPELPNTERILLRPDGNGHLQVFFSEIPDEKIAEPFLSKLDKMGGILSALLSVLEKKLGKDFLAKRLTAAFHPTVLAFNTALPGWQSLLDEESARTEEAAKSTKIITALISRFLSEGDAEQPETEDRGFFRNAIGGILGRFRG